MMNQMLFDNYFGIILPYFEEGVCETVCKDLLKDKFLTEEVSEKIRLFYVALTRAREKIIMVLPKKENNYVVEKIVPNNHRLKYRSIADMIYSLGDKLNDYSKEINLDELELTRNYQTFITKDLSSLFLDKYDKIEVSELIFEPEYITESSFSKKATKLITKEIKNNMDLGLEIHTILENLDFHNPNFQLIENKFYRNKVENFYFKLTDIDKAKVYQEHEFMYEKDGNIYHGIIDLLLEYEDHIDIIDYKLKYTNDDAYIKQLDGYKTYVLNITNKQINVWLYSIMDEEFTKLV